MGFLGELVVKIVGDSAEFEKAIDSSQNKLSAFADKAVNIGKNLTLSVTLPILGIGAAMVKTASDAEETSSKFNTVFRDLSDVANTVADDLSTNFGLSSKAAKQLLSDTGDLLTGFGFTQEQALDLSNRVQELAVDLSSFTNYAGGAEGASVALTKALLGEAESAKSLGIIINQNTQEYKDLVTQGVEVEGLTLLQAKAMAALTIATEQSQNAIGDYERTSDSTANQMKLLVQDIDDMAVSFGELLLPVANDIIAVFSDMINWLTDLDEGTKKIIIAVAAFVAAVGPVILVIGLATKAFIAMKAAMAGSLGPITLAIAGIGLLVGVITAVSNEQERFNNRFTDAASAAKEQSDRVGDLLEQYDTLKKESEENEDAQRNLKGVIQELAILLPTAAVEFDEYGNSIDIVREKAGAFYEESLENQVELYENDLKARNEQLNSINILYAAKLEELKIDTESAALREKYLESQADINAAAENREKLVEESNALFLEQQDILAVIAKIEEDLAAARIAADPELKAIEEERLAAIQRNIEEQNRLADEETRLEQERIEREEERLEKEKEYAELRDEFRFNNLSKEEQAIEELNTLRDEYAEAGIETEEWYQSQLAEIREKYREEEEEGINRQTISFLQMLEEQENAAVETAEVFSNQISEQLNEYLEAYSIMNNVAQSFFSSLSELALALTNKRIEEIDRWLQAELEAAGLVEETTVERLQRELDEAIASGDMETE